jgi:hypothetical protein
MNLLKIYKKKMLGALTFNIEEINAQIKNFKELKINLPIFKMKKEKLLTIKRIN